MLVPVVIHKDVDSDFGVTVPDLPGCFSAGATLDEALTQAQEAIELHLEGMLEDGESLPCTTPIEMLQKKRIYKGGVWHLVNIDPTKISGKARRINVTIPERLLQQIDNAARSDHMTRSGYLAAAAMEKILRSDSG